MTEIIFGLAIVFTIPALVCNSFAKWVGRRKPNWSSRQKAISRTTAYLLGHLGLGACLLFCIGSLLLRQNSGYDGYFKIGVGYLLVVGSFVWLGFTVIGIVGTLLSVYAQSKKPL